VKELNFDKEDVKVLLYTYIGQGSQYKTITNLAPINNLEAAVNL
jgi:hypothetical protein